MALSTRALSTRQAIIESFLHIVAKKPPEKITVRDIVDDCDINRNTFYYYFQDMYAVIEELFDSLMASLPEEAPLGETVAQLYAGLYAFAAERPAAARSLALSLGYEGLERYLGKHLEALMLARFIAAGGDLPSPLQLRLSRHAILGVCLDALRGGKQPAPTPDELGALLVSTASPLPTPKERKDNV